MISSSIWRVLGACVAALAVAACAGMPASPGGVGPRSTHSLSSSFSHLYVADPGSGAIYRYPLVDGLPQTTPDETFAQLPNVDHLGVDAGGNIYATAGQTIDRFAGDGTLTGYFTVPTAVGAFAVDRRGFTFVVTSSAQISVYSPKAYQTHGSAKPIATLSAVGYNYDQILFLATDASGLVYAATWFALDIWKHPHRTSSEQSLSIQPPLPKINPGSALFNGALAFDEGGRLYAGIGYSSYCEPRCKKQYWMDTDFDAIHGLLRPGRADRMIYAGECSLNYSSYMVGGT
ncbi:MAG TPA: hypothetical protein VGI19_02690, partial [Candidatus Cybelea sp.]